MIIYLFTTGNSLFASVWTVYFVLVMLSDNILKPMLLGKGAQVPMLVIFLGVLGGFFLSGIIESDMTAGVRGKYDALIEGGLLLEKRWGTPEDVSRAVCVLASGELPYATGAVLVVDGGLTLARL